MLLQCAIKKNQHVDNAKVTYLMQAGLSKYCTKFFHAVRLRLQSVSSCFRCAVLSLDSFRSDIVALSEKLGQFVLAHTLLLHERADPSTSRVRYIIISNSFSYLFICVATRVLLVVVAGLF